MCSNKSSILNKRTSKIITASKRRFPDVPHHSISCFYLCRVYNPKMTQFVHICTYLFMLFTVRACYQSSWSPWINDYKPSTKLFPQERKEGITKGGGDIETMSQTERDRFCNPGHGTITNIECETVDGRSYNATGWAHLECSVDTGFKCSNRFSTGLCADYRIRLYCQCNSEYFTSYIFS